MTDPDKEIHDLVRQEAGDALERMEQNLLALEAGDAGPDAVDAIFRDAHSIKGSASMVGWEETAALAHAIEDHLEAARDKGALDAKMIDPLLRARDALARTVEGEVGAGAEILAELAAAGGKRKPAAKGKGSDPEPAAAPAAETLSEAAQADQRSIRIPAGKVDRMLDVVGETVLYHRRLEHALGDAVRDSRSEAAEELDMGGRLLDELQDSVIQMRTLPLSTITTPFRRSVRDLATAEGKEVELTISGAETQLDRVILEGISETITHLLRNAVAHGIESPKERKAAGKPEGGSIELRAEQRGGMVAIEVADDGRGVSEELIERAKQVGSLADVLAEAGFSTAGEVSDVAGRGVGLDAVKLHVESLSGSLEVRSDPGQGAVVIMLLPLTLALLRVLLFERDDRPYALPMASIGRVFAVTDTTSLGNRPSVELEGEAVSVSDIAALIGAPVTELGERPPALVIESTGRSIAVACDGLIGEDEVVIKSLGAILSPVPGYLGAAILGDGRIALVLDPNHLLKSASRRPAAAPLHADEEEEGLAPKVLVVDDQFAARELQRSILETASYRIATARDGKEALALLREDDEIELVLSDVQMPEMDGFELLETIRRDEKLGSLPVVMVTTLGDEKSRQRGADAGADAYIVKDEFDQRTLLETIERLLGR